MKPLYQSLICRSENDVLLSSSSRSSFGILCILLPILLLLLPGCLKTRTLPGARTDGRPSLHRVSSAVVGGGRRWSEMIQRLPAAVGDALAVVGGGRSCFGGCRRRSGFLRRSAHHARRPYWRTRSQCALPLWTVRRRACSTSTRPYKHTARSSIAVPPDRTNTLPDRRSLFHQTARAACRLASRSANPCVQSALLITISGESVPRLPTIFISGRHRSIAAAAAAAAAAAQRVALSP